MVWFEWSLTQTALVLAGSQAISRHSGHSDRYVAMDVGPAAQHSDAESEQQQLLQPAEGPQEGGRASVGGGGAVGGGWGSHEGHQNLWERVLGRMEFMHLPRALDRATHSSESAQSTADLMVTEVRITQPAAQHGAEPLASEASAPSRGPIVADTPPLAPATSPLPFLSSSSSVHLGLPPTTAVELAPGMAAVSAWVESLLPFVLLLSTVFLYEHSRGILVFIWSNPKP